MVGEGTSPTTTPQPPAAVTQTGFLARASNGALFIQWTRTGSTVTGSFTEAYTTSCSFGCSSPIELQTERHPFTGVVSGSTVTLTSSLSSWSASGTLNDSDLTLNLPNSDGTLSPFEFHPASVADYDAAVSAEQAEVANAQQQQARARAAAQARQQRAQAEANAESAIDSAASTVQNDISTLSGDTSTAETDLASVPTDLASEAKDVATAKADLKVTLRDTPDQVCTDADGVSSDSDSVASDDDGIQSDNDSVTGDLSTIAADIGRLNADSQRLETARAARPKYVPADGLPTATDSSRAIASANAAASHVRKTMDGYIAQSKQMLATANGYATQAQAACTKTGG